MKDTAIQSALARIMVAGVALAALLLLVGMAMYLPVYGDRPQGDRIFTGEPEILTHPALVVTHAIGFHQKEHIRSFMQLGVLVLLLNPLVRVILAGLGFAAQRDWLYAAASALVLAALAVSFLL